MKSFYFKLLPFLFLFVAKVHAQQYIEYHRQMNRIDEDILKNELTSALIRFDSIYYRYDFIFARHCFKALQISCSTKDSLRANQWLEKAFIQGVPLWMIRNNEITKNCLFYSTTSATIKGYDSLRNSYTKAIDTSLRKQIDSLIEIDQYYTRKVNDGFILTRYTYHAIRWLRNNKKQVEILKKIIEEKGYPGEKIIGLPLPMNDSILSINRFYRNGPWLRETHAYIMFIHYYSNRRPDINNMLIEQINKGNLLPYQFGSFNDFLARWGKRKYNNTYYNVWHKDPNSDKENEINNRRYRIGLNTIKEQDIIETISNERIKNRSANSSIILE
jgi:hypothetical protein